MLIADLPGIGLRMWTSADATAYAMFLDSVGHALDLVPRPSTDS